jgi:hypothetical protein
MAEPRRPSDFAEILGGPELPLIVGGQAVNIWAEIYAQASPGLEAFEPFSSRDADILGNRALAETLAKKAGWKCRFIDQNNSLVIAVLTGPDGGGKPLTIDVLQEVNGLTEADLAANQVIETATGARFRIPSPIVLLKAKLYNLISLANQERPQDIKHAKMLVHIVPLYLREMLTEHIGGRLDEQRFRAAVDYALEVAGASFAGNAARSHDLDLTSIVPGDIVRRTR